MMDCDTTGIEPDLALVKQKRLVGGGVIKIVNNTVPAGSDAARLRSGGRRKDRRLHRRASQDRRRARPQAEHLPVFDCSLAPMGGGRSIAWRGHLRMMAAAQPFLSGAISKTINMPEESTVEDIMEAYTESWKFGLKAVAIYRDNSKRSQPLSAAGKKEDEKAAAPAATAAAAPVVDRPLARPEVPALQQELFQGTKRRKLPAERNSITHKFSVGGHEGYITVGDVRRRPPRRNLHQDGQRRLHAVRHHGRLRAFRLDFACNTASRSARWSTNSSTRASSLPATRAIRGSATRSRWSITSAAGWAENSSRRTISITTARATEDQASGCGRRYQRRKLHEPATLASPTVPKPSTRPRAAIEDAPYCSECGMLMTPNGSCYKCANCGSTSGCS